MSDNSAIEWTDSTWNPIRARNLKTGKVGWHCEHATTGCEFCYAEGFNKRLGTGMAFKPGHRADIDIFLNEAMLTQPLRWKKPRRIFVCSMTDLFADFVTDDMLDKMFAVMALAQQHTFQVLTKRAARMLEYCSTIQTNCRWLQMEDVALHLGFEPRGLHDHGFDWISNKQFLPNVWLGVSTERQQEADERIPLLLQTPAAVRFMSAEPLLGPIDLTPKADAVYQELSKWYDENGKFDPDTPRAPRERRLGWFPRIDWMIVGGESGRGARPMHPDWARSLRDQCAAAGVAFFFKQWGEWAPSTPEAAAGNPHSGWKALGAYPHVAKAAELYPEAGAEFIARVGKKAAGRLLDGVEHNGMPGGPA
jgi:protein gp37